MVQDLKGQLRRLRKGELPKQQEPVQQQEPSLYDQVSGYVGEGVARTLGAPVDVVTGAINLGSEALGLGQAIDPNTTALGSEFWRDFQKGSETGLGVLGRGVGVLPEQTEEQQLLEQQAREKGGAGYMAGEIATEALPFAAVPIAGVKSLLMRAGLTGILGGLEANVISRGQGNQGAEISEATGLGAGLGVASEVLFPVVGRVASKLYRKVKGVAPKGQLIDNNLKPTKELSALLNELNMTYDDLTPEVIKQLDEGLSPEQVERAARFKRQNIPTTRGVITQDDVLLGREETLLGRVDEVGQVISAPLRERKLAQSNAFIRYAENLADDLGFGEDAANNLKDALLNRRKLLTGQKNELYSQAIKASPELTNVPMFTDNLVDILPSPSEMKRMKRIKGSQVDALNDLMIEFGVLDDVDDVTKFLDAGNEITPLNFGNFEDFRQGLNQIMRADQSNVTKVVGGKIIKALDDELDVAYKALKEGGDVDPQSIELFKQARQKVRELKVEFDPDDLSGLLIQKKKNGNFYKKETSQILDAVLSKNVPYEATERLLKTIVKAPNGKQVLGDIQSAVVLRLLDDATSTISNRSGGQQMFNANAFLRSINKIGEDKLKVVFGNNSKGYKELMDLAKSAAETTTPATTKPKGSAPAVNALLSMMQGLISLPVIKQFGDAIEIGVKSAQVRKTLDLTPQQKRSKAITQYVQAELPSLATALGLPVLIDEENEQ